MTMTEPQASHTDPSEAPTNRDLLAGFGVAGCWLVSIVASSPPDASASDQTWVANYATHSKQIGHLVSGVFLVLAGLCLMVFLNSLWTRVARARAPRPTSPLPLVAAGAAAACIGVGGIVMGSVSGDALFGSAPIPSAELLRFTNDTGVAIVLIAGMLATAASVGSLGVMARRAGVFSARLSTFTVVVAVLLVAGLAFLPVLLLLVWSVIVATAILRRPKLD